MILTWGIGQHYWSVHPTAIDASRKRSTKLVPMIRLSKGALMKKAVGYIKTNAMRVVTVHLTAAKKTFVIVEQTSIGTEHFFYS